jgi:hypothetical protein
MIRSGDQPVPTHHGDEGQAQTAGAGPNDGMSALGQRVVWWARAPGYFRFAPNFGR